MEQKAGPGQHDLGVRGSGLELRTTLHNKHYSDSRFRNHIAVSGNTFKALFPATGTHIRTPRKCAGFSTGSDFGPIR